MTAPIQPTSSVDPHAVFLKLLEAVGPSQPQPTQKPTFIEALKSLLPDMRKAMERAAADATATKVQPKPGDDLTSIAQAKWEMTNLGITAAQRAKAYQGRVSDAAYANITPFGYGGHDREMLRAMGAVLSLGTIDTDPAHGRMKLYPDFPLWRSGDGAREDAWRLYLGLPQMNNTFSISDYRPSKGGDQKPYFKINSLSSRVQGDLRDLVQFLTKEHPGSAMPAEDDWAGVMGNFHFTHGVDEKGPYVAYYDLWDLAHPAARLVGHPIEIYDRIHYDPKTYRIIPDAASSPPTQQHAKAEAPRGRPTIYDLMYRAGEP